MSASIRIISRREEEEASGPLEKEELNIFFLLATVRSSLRQGLIALEFFEWVIDVAHYNYFGLMFGFINVELIGFSRIIVGPREFGRTSVTSYGTLI